MTSRARFLHEDTNLRVKPCSGTNDKEEGKRYAFCSWKYGHYFELLQKNNKKNKKNTHTHTHTQTQMLDQVPADLARRYWWEMSGQRRESNLWPVAGMRAPVVRGMVAGGHIMPPVEMSGTSGKQRHLPRLLVAPSCSIWGCHQRCHSWVPLPQTELAVSLQMAQPFGRLVFVPRASSYIGGWHYISLQKHHKSY